MPQAAALTIVAEYTRTAGTGAYTVAGRVARAARFAEFYVPGDVFDYYADDGGGLAEYAVGQLAADGTISRQSIYWTTLGGVGAGPIAWAPTGRRTIRAVISAIGAPTRAPWNINGFWDGDVATDEKIERYLFAQEGTLAAGLPGSLIRSDPTGTAPTVNFIVTEGGDHIIDETGADVVDATGGVPALMDAPTLMTMVVIQDETGADIINETGDVVVESLDTGAMVLDLRLNGVNVGTATFSPGAPQGILALPVPVHANVGDLFEIVGGSVVDPTVQNLVWTFVVS